MIRKIAVMAALAGAMWASSASAQVRKWHVVLYEADIVVFATDATGPSDEREAASMVLLPKAVGGIDMSTNNWRIDCDRSAVLDLGGDAYLGTTRNGALDSTTPNGPVTFDDKNAALAGLIGENICQGKRLSNDDTILTGDDAARAYGRKRFGQ